MNRVVLGALLSHWRRHPLQLLTLVLGLALATALWSGVQAINAEARASYARAAGALGQGDLAQITGPEALMTRETFVALRRAGWLVTPVLEGPMTLGRAHFTLRGVDAMTAPAPAQGAMVATGKGGQKAETQGAADIAVPEGGVIFGAPETLLRLGGQSGLPPLRPLAGLRQGLLLTDMATAERLLGMQGWVSRFLLLADQPMGRPPLSSIAAGLKVTQKPSGNDLARLTASFHLNLTAFGLLSFAVGLFIVHGAIGLAFEQRRAGLRSLRAIGVPLGRLILLSLGELLVIAAVAGLIGTLLGYLIAGLLLPDVAATLRGLYGADIAGTLKFRPGWVAAGLAMAIGGTLIAAAQALWRLARLPLLAGAHPRAWAQGGKRMLGVQAMAAAALVAGGGLFAALGGGLLAGFLSLGGILLGAALALPVILSLALGRAARGRSALAEWFWADTRQQLPGLSLALMALMLALSANVGVSTMVSSFRQTFTGYLDQRLASELYISARTPGESAALAAFVAPRVRAVLPIWSVPISIAGRQVQVYGLVDDPTYRDNWPVLRGAADGWDRLAAGRGVMINEQLGYRLGLAPGDMLRLAPDWSLPVVGIYSDYGNPEGQALVASPSLAARYPSAPRLRFGLRLARADIPALRRALTRDFGLPAENIIDQSALKASSLAVFERTFAVTGALNILTLAVAGFALMTSFLTLSDMRLPQLAPVWALGLTRRRLAWLELWRSLALAGFTMVLAVPVGLILAWVLLNVVNVMAFGWRLPMYLFPGEWLRLGGLAALAAALAGALPARRLARVAPARLLKVFADER